MRNHITFGGLATGALLALACADQPAAPNTEVAGLTAEPAFQAWGPETPQFNLEVVLRGDGFGLVKFRQPNDGATVVYLDTWVRDLAPNTSYRLQRAVDTVIDDVCTNASGWLTLGQGLTPYAIQTDESGTGRAALWRAVPPVVGAEFDINFRVIDDATGAVVLQSECYQYRVSL
ncbi:MAG: hypothetical protein ACRDHY_09870 [Anaerolineales bacterium]